MGVAGGAGLGLGDHVDMKCFIGDGGEGGGERTYSYSTAPHSENGDKMV
jgi:hypothetical protein